MENANSSLNFLQSGVGSSSAESTAKATDEFVFADASTDFADTAEGSADAAAANAIDFAQAFDFGALSAVEAPVAAPAESADVEPAESVPFADLPGFDGFFG